MQYHSAVAVAKAFLELAKRENKSLTNMQLQKLVYFAHGIHMSAYEGCPLINEHVKAWNFGPVIPELYEALRKYGSDEVSEISSPDYGNLQSDADAMKAIKIVWQAFRGVPASKLSDISHAKGSPWDIVFNKENRKFCDIPDDLTRTYYDTVVVRNNV